MIVREPFYLWPKHGLPQFVPVGLVHQIGTNVPNFIRVRVGGCEGIFRAGAQHSHPPT